ncbi:hypothetical protein V7O66_00395 [Methanolobus sp. ZRKC3]|uniref:hypothetical protein n=1 Tax=Methanolobus sp. ZRKC3 TaxID=3125786 RepID=UPI0032439EF8
MKKRIRSHTEDEPLTSSLNGCNRSKRIKAQSERFLRDTRGIDTIALKMVFYLAITGTILFLVTVSWGNVSPFFEKVQTDEQVKDLAVELLSIQNGYARDLRDSTAVQGSTCTVKVTLPESVRFLSMGVDPDPDSDGNLTNSGWIVENSTILVQYNNGEKNRFLIKENIQFRKGNLSQNDNWNLYSSKGYDNIGIVIENPVKGDFIFEFVYDARGKYTISHF